MTAPTRIPWEQAVAVGNEVRALLIDSCERIEVVGSVRRLATMVKDVEFLIEPRSETRVVDLFGNEDRFNILEGRCAQLRGEDVFTNIQCWGAKQKRFAVHGVTVELFIVDVGLSPFPQWGLAMVLRTGPWEFSKRLVSQRAISGLLPNNYRVHDFGIYDGQRLLATPTEADVFRVLGLDYLAPEQRR